MPVELALDEPWMDVVLDADEERLLRCAPVVRTAGGTLIALRVFDVRDLLRAPDEVQAAAFRCLAAAKSATGWAPDFVVEEGPLVVITARAGIATPSAVVRIVTVVGRGAPDVERREAVVAVVADDEGDPAFVLRADAPAGAALHPFHDAFVRLVHDAGCA